MQHIESEPTSAFLVQTQALSLWHQRVSENSKDNSKLSVAPADSGSSSPRDVLYDIKPSMRSLRSHSAVYR